MFVYIIRSLFRISPINIMTNQEIASLKEHFDLKVKEVSDNHKAQRNWLLGILVGLLTIFIIIGSVEIRTTQKNKDSINDLRDKASTHISRREVMIIMNSYDLQSRALISFIEDPNQTLPELLKEFQEFRWSIMQDNIEDSRIKRGGDPEPEAEIKHENINRVYLAGFITDNSLFLALFFLGIGICLIIRKFRIC